MQRIEILSNQVETKTGTSTSGKAYAIREQSAVLHDSTKKYPQPCRVQLDRDQAPYEVGTYDIGSPFSVGQWESLRANRDMGLVLVKQQQRAAA